MSAQVLGSPTGGHGRFRPRVVGFHPPLGLRLFQRERAAWLTDHVDSSARDQLTNQSVAVKKIMKPFSTPVLAKRTYRELKLLKHLRHENVGRPTRFDSGGRGVVCVSDLEY